MPEEQKAPPVEAIAVEDQEAMIGSAFDDPSKPKVGFVALDENGAPSGEVLTERPAEGPYITVKGTTAATRDELTTPTGAPLTTQMNPDHSVVDPALVGRNSALGA